MAKEPTNNHTANVRAESHPNLEEEIRRRAFEIYEQRGREDGYDLDDWLRAEAETNGSAVKSTAA